MSAVFQVPIVIILAIYAYFLAKSRLSGKVLLRSALVIFAAGVTLHMYAYYAYEGYLQGPVTAFLRSIFFTLKMFLYEDSFLDVPLIQEQVPYFTDLYVLVFYAAMLTSISAIINLFARRAMTFLIVVFRKKKFDHVFLGVNRNSEMVARGIKDQQIAFIEFPSDSKEEEFSISTVLKSISQSSESQSSFTDKNVVVLKAKRGLTYVDGGGDVFELIGLPRMKRLVDANTSFYLLSDNSERNLNDLMAIMNDSSLRQNTVHTSASREGVAQSYKLVLGKTGAHFIYPSSLSVVELMKDPSCHPVSVMTLDTDERGHNTGAVSGSFNAMVVGFGETGQSALKFLYEFASAVRRDGSVLPVKIYVTDHRLERPQGQFEFSCPDMEHGDIVVYDHFGLDSSQFWQNLLQSLDDLNYIVISMQDDTQNLDLACTIFAYVQKKRKNGFANLKILVRKRSTPDYERKLVQRLNDKAGMPVIQCFGEYTKIFTPEMIVSKHSSGINSNAMSIADRLAQSFADVTSEVGRTDIDKESYHQIKTSRRQTHQMISSANHIPDKLSMSGGQLDELNLENLAICEHLRYKRYLLAHGYSFDTDDDDVLLTNHQICSWAELSDADREYHRNMVRASFMVK